MRNEAGDIVQDHNEDLKETAQEWKSKACAAGTAAWDATRATYQQIQDKTIEYSKVTDRAIRERPYAALGIAFGVGLVIGFLVTGGSQVEEED
ncbi:MAG: hypothetical protein ABIP71_06245 [Verrucomicrobiota bacterium]